MSEIRFSIITCFHNSIHRLDHYFAAVRALEIGPLQVEFIFVDNASNDGTPGRLAQEAATVSAPSQVLAEPVPGLMFARCRGVVAARGELVLFLDDDNEPAPDYLRQLERLMQAFPDFVMITGNAMPPADYPVNDGNREALPLLVARNLPGEFAFNLDTFGSPFFPWGAGLFARRTGMAEACDRWRLGDRRVTGRSGGKLSGGEDVWLAHFLSRKGGKVVFSEHLKIVHRFDRTRLGPAYLGRLSFENGLEFMGHTEAVHEVKPSIPVPRITAKYMVLALFVRLPVRLAICWWRRDTTAFTKAASSLGHVYYLLARLLI